MFHPSVCRCKMLTCLTLPAPSEGRLWWRCVRRRLGWEGRALGGRSQPARRAGWRGGPARRTAGRWRGKTAPDTSPPAPASWNSECRAEENYTDRVGALCLVLLPARPGQLGRAAVALVSAGCRQCCSEPLCCQGPGGGEGGPAERAEAGVGLAAGAGQVAVTCTAVHNCTVL